MSFLKAEWRKLVMINYKVTPELLKSYVPVGTELDFFQGNCYVSLIGFMFKNTKLLGVKIPFHTNFEEVNLRFYVKRKDKNVWKRGVVFIKEIVPKPAITFVANTIYNENYQTLPMKHSWKIDNNNIEVDYLWKSSSSWNSISVLAENTLIDIEKDSEVEFIAEHYWGYAKHKLKTNEYEVVHPSWKYYPVVEWKIDVNFKETYGIDFKFLKETTPASVFLLEGSEISVENKIEMI
ncbi:YqjF family protein [Tenacibaculum xiamenense]|uniref:YqjF family protein n=1 Tax=Tenacibaculum xiamenense TaxID=1261553 RepID=UPI00389428C3